MSSQFNPEAAMARVRLTAKEAAKMFGVARGTVGYWDRIGLIHPIGRTTFGARLYSYAELVEAEKTARENPRSHRDQGRLT
jgi:predicted site-specific integrase-resolvase